MKLILSPRDWCYCSSLLLCVLVFLFLSISVRSTLSPSPLFLGSYSLLSVSCISFLFFSVFLVFYLTSVFYSFLPSLVWLFFLICCSFLCIYRQSGRRSPYLVQLQGMVAQGFPGFLYQGGRGLCQGERERKWAGKKDFEKHSSLHHIIKSNPGLTRPRDRVPGFMGQLGSTQKN